MYNRDLTMKTMIRYRHTKAIAMLLLLLMCVCGAWAEGTTTPTYYLNDDTGGTWTSDNTGRYTVSTGSGYAEINAVGTGDNGTRVYTASTRNLVGAGISFILQFDIKIKGGTNQTSWFQVNDVTNTPVYTGGSASNTTASSVLQLAQTAAGGTTWSINGSDTQNVTLANDKWYTIKVLRTYNKTYLTVTKIEDSSTVLAETEITTNSTVGGLGNMEFATKRYYSSLAIDNVKVQKWGWDVTTHSVSLTDVNNDNKISAGMPILYNPDNAAVTYTYDGTVLSSFDATYAPSPRLKATGTGTVTASIGGKTAQYSLTVSAANGGGSYDASTNTYTFNTVGVIADRSIDDVPFINMSFRGGPTAVVVNDGVRNVLKVIDANGYSHPNLDNGASKIPPETNWGGTFYKFVPSVSGRLTVNGNMDYAVIYASDNLTSPKASAISGTSIANVELESGKTYYLYNAGSDSKGSSSPLLHSFQFIPNSSSLTFRNPQPVITIDVSETSYTNPAISASGLPVSYLVLSGPGAVNAEGTVTFTGDYFLNPQPIVVKATAGSDIVTYTINLVKRTWIFNENSKWATESGDLTGGGWDTNGGSGYTYTGNGLNGSKFSRNTTAMSYVELTQDGSTVIPETSGLLFNKAANNDRLYIAPKDYAANFLAMRASSISIDDVQEGQTVTVNWTGGSSTAVLDMQDAAGANVTGSRGGTLQLTATQTGRVEIYSNPVVAYINSISVSTPTRAIGTLTYAKNVLSTSGGNESRTGYTITTEDGTVDLRDAYGGPGNFKSSNTSVASVDASGNITPVGVGTAIISATATAKSSATHQTTVTLVATIEVVSSAATRIRTISVSDLLYTTGSTTAADYDRIIPGFTFAYTGADGNVTSTSSNSITLSSGGKLVIAPRPNNETITIEQALVTVKTATSSPTWKVNGSAGPAISADGISLTSLGSETLTLELTAGSVELTDIKLYYHCSDAENADNCLDETKSGPAITFDDTHLMRIPNDGYAFSQTPTQVVTDNFHSFSLSYTYASSATTVATINSNGTNGQLLKSGESTITATFHETTYFAGATATYTINNTLLPGETYLGDRDDVDVNMTNGQFIHVEASASSTGTALTLSGTANPASQLTFGTTRSRQNTYARATGIVKLENSTDDKDIIIYSYTVVTKSLRKWLYYQGQEDNYFEQVHFKGFATGAVKGFRVVDVGDPDNPIDLTDAYEMKDENYTIADPSVADLLTDVTLSTGEATASKVGYATISHGLTKKDGMADGYDSELTVSSIIQVLDFGDDDPVVWDFMSVDNGNNVLGKGWTYDEREFQYGYFSEYTPIFNNANDAVISDKHGILLKDEYRWYHTRGLRANLSQAKASYKFPVKAGMEIDVYAATSSADVSNVISNVTDIYGNDTEVLYIEQEGESSPVHNYFLAKEDGMVEIKVTDKVGMYLHNITLRVPRIHFTDEVVTQLPTGDDGFRHVTNAATNIPEESLSLLSYSITEAKDFGGDDITPANIATIDNGGAVGSTGVLTLADPEGVGWKEGWFEVTVTNTNGSRSKLEPKTGTYKVYVVDFKFDPATVDLSLDNHDGEDYYGGDDTSTDNYPVGKDNVVTPITYSYEIPDESAARAMLKQVTKIVPGQTTYQLTAYSTGTINLLATTGRITAVCELTVTGNAFGEVGPVLSDKDIDAVSGIYTNRLPSGFTYANTTLNVKCSGDIANLPTYVVEDVNDGINLFSQVKLTGLDNLGGHGAIRCIATSHQLVSDNGTPGDPSDDVYTDKTVQFVLTIAYPASSNKKWDFYRLKNGTASTDGLKAESDHENKIGDYTSASVAGYTITGTGSWTTSTSWTRIYRNGIKEPRWALDRSMHRDNAFVIEETAGLQIETPTNSFYVDNNSGAAYTHVGIHSNSTITIPKLKNGDFVSLNLSRVIPNNGAIIKAVNVCDLTGRVISDAFTITRSQTDYREDGELARDAEDKRVIPGYYTFMAHKDGATETDEFDVSFTLADEGYLDVLSIEIYSPGSRDSGNGNDPETGYDYTMLPVKLDATGYPAPPATLLKKDGQQIVYDLTFCHPLWSTSVSRAEYVLLEKTDNLNVDFENVGWYSDGGAFYNSGRITVNDGYGRILIRMNNYTSDGKYLIGYTPSYALTVGHPPHQDYPYTWNFENISGGAVKNKGNNAYNSINSDYYTWIGLGYESYRLDTRSSGGSLYVPGATLVTSARDLGAKGTIAELNSSNLGCDEFNGLGFDGQFTCRVALQGAAEPATPAPLNANGSLLEYEMKSPQAYTVADEVITWAAADKPAAAETKQYWTAGDGLVKFGSAGKRQASAVAEEGAVYLMDGGNTKNLLLKPERRLQEGDVIYLKGYVPNNVDVLKSGFSFYAGSTDNSYDDLVTLNWTSSDNSAEQELTYTVKQGDGLAGRDSVYLFRAGKQYSVYLTKITITTADESTPTIPERALTCNGAVTVTIPDLKLDHYVYIKSSAVPSTVPSSLTAAVTADGLDAIPYDGDDEVGVWKYKVIAAGDANVTFADGTKIYRIGVTDIFKTLKRVGTGDAWATESRNHAIDYTQTGIFTVNDITANTVTATNYTLQKVTVRMNEQTDAMPAETGMVLKLGLPDATAVTNFGKAKSGNSLPLFYPPYSKPILSSTVVGFDGTQGNLMKANLTSTTFDSETEGDFTRFIFADRYMKWTKVTDEPITHEDFTDSGNVPVFYRMHLYETTDFDPEKTQSEVDELNTLGANKAYMLIRTGNVPDALWNSGGSAKRFIAIEGISDFEEIIDYSDKSEDSQGEGQTENGEAHSAPIYNLRGQLMGDDESVLFPGIYIRNGKKFIVR